MPDEADDLYRVEPEAFVAARDALVKELRASGEREEAARVAKLRRPSPGAWALNKVARSEPELVEAALAAGVALRRATDAAVAGDPAGLRSATADARRTADAVINAAAGLLGPRGASSRAELAAAMNAVALDHDVADELRSGTLSALPDSSGFGFGFDAGSDVAPSVDLKLAESNERRRRRAEREAEVDRLEGDAARMAAEAEEAEAAARDARTRAEAAEQAAAAARAALSDENDDQS